MGRQSHRGQHHLRNRAFHRKHRPTIRHPLLRIGGTVRLHHRSIHRHDSAACLRHIASTSAPQRHHQRRHLRYRLLPAVRHRRIRIHHPGGHGAAVHRGPLRGAHPRHRHLWTRHGPHPAFIRADHHHRDHQLDWLYHRRIHRLGRCRAKLDRHRLRGRLLRWRSLYASGHRPTTCASDQSVRDHVARIVLLRSRRGASAGRNHDHSSLGCALIFAGTILAQLPIDQLLHAAKRKPADVSRP